MKTPIDAILKNVVQVFSKEGLKERLGSGRKLKVKLGADPSRPDLHLGHAVVLRALRPFQDLGHEVIFIVGDFTAMIGDPSGRKTMRQTPLVCETNDDSAHRNADPSGRSKTRPTLTFAETRKAGETYFRQAVKILDASRTRIEYNSTWLSKLAFEDVLALTGKYTVARILERDDFKKRYEANQPIGVHELLYPLLQGYDSVALQADVEIGGTDQTFNLLVGRELQKSYGQRPQEVITFPLLIGLDGTEKMSKSLDNYIGLDEPPERMYEKAMKIPDPLLPDYFRLTTDRPMEEIERLVKKDIRAAHREYGEELIRMYHRETAIAGAAARYTEIAGGRLPESMAAYVIDRRTWRDNRLGILEALVAVGFAASKGEARRLIDGRGIKIDHETVTDINLVLDVTEDKVIQFGKNRFVRLTTKSC